MTGPKWSAEALLAEILNFLKTGTLNTASSSGSGSDVNINGVGGNAVGATIPVSGTITVGNQPNVTLIDEFGGPVGVAGAPLRIDPTGTTTQPVSGTVAVTGVATAALQSADAVLIGAVTETAPATDTASSGLNGRLQRIAQRITSLIALIPAALGAGGGLKVDGSGTALPVSGTVTVGAITAGETHVGQIGGTKTRVSVEKTRPSDTTAYAAKDAISESTSAGTVWTFASLARLTGGSGYIVRATMLTDQTTNTEAFRLHLFNAAPTALNDNVACTAPLYANAGTYVGTIDLPAARVEAAGATAAYANATPNTASCNLPMAFKCAADSSLYGLLETPAGFTPASAQKITLVLFADVD